MNRLVKAILSPPTGDPPNGHPSDEDIARLAEGAVDGQERERLAEHVNRCERCYQVLSGIMADLKAAEAKPRTWWARNSSQLIAVAASLIMVVLVGGGLYQYQSDQQQPLVASLPPDPDQRRAMAESKPNEESIGILSGQAPRSKSSTADRSLADKQAPIPKPRRESKRMLLSEAPPSKSGSPAGGMRAKPAPRPQPSRESSGIGGGQAPLHASLPLDRELRDLVLQGSQQGWRNPDAVARLIVELKKRGLQVGKVLQVVLVGRRLPTMAPMRPELLKIRIKGGVIHLTVVDAKR